MSGGKGTVFNDRVDAGRQLAAQLKPWMTELPTDARANVIVLGLPRGGVPVAAEVAAALDAPLDVIVVRKLGMPFHPEVAMGAIGEDGVRVLDRDLIGWGGITAAQIASVERDERATLEARVARFRSGFEPLDLSGRIALIIDDGIATGATASAACTVARALGASRVIVAAPVGGPEAERQVQGANEVICLIQPPGFYAVGAHYRDFSQTREGEVLELLDDARKRTGGGSSTRNPWGSEFRRLS
ncbi:MAG: phosphoribosyltransferase family protein [Actinomycetota bacterium]